VLQAVRDEAPHTEEHVLIGYLKAKQRILFRKT